MVRLSLAACALGVNRRIRPSRRPPRALAAVSRTAAFSVAAAAAVLVAASVTAQAAWIPLKAELAQWLMQRAWDAARAGDPAARPWPWADTRPVAVLRVPRLGIRQWVLEGQSGRNLAFGPVFAGGANSGRDRVISGHRDTHFRFLERLRPGDRIELQDPDGTRTFEVRYLDVVDSRRAELVLEPGVERLSLVTCYPFDAASAGGPLRYVVTAAPVSSRPRSVSSG